ncbi:MAG: SoxR reducing system RseC family protein [Gammaproteobacteria bacterium]|nr:SoxR reducing system RseC family protein [Gammaproteobacteria bacterium]
MLTEVGRVVAIEHDSLWVETLRQSTCGACVAQKGCGHGLLSRMGSGGRNYIRVLLGDQRSAQYALDDQVRIAIPEQVILRSSFVVYLLPLFCMLLLAAGLAQGFPQHSTDLMASLGAVLGFLLGIALVRLHAWWYRNDMELQPRLLGRVGPAPAIESPEMA